jgi:hypothetical protein
VRYQKIDLKKSWDQIVFGFPVQFHQDAPRRANLQDDFHKNNDIVALGEDGNAVFGLNGRQEWIRMDIKHVKDHNVVEGVPVTFVERYPWGGIGK